MCRNRPKGNKGGRIAEFGIHNIFKLFQVEYVRRINYLDWGARKWGVRFTFRATF